MSSPDPRPVWILGAGRSGQAATRLAEAEGRAVRIFDENQDTSLPAEEGGANVDWIVSPGFPVDHPWCQAVREAGGVLVPEMEFGASCLRGEILAVTGSLGKTSMVLFAKELLHAIGVKVTVSGNIGTAVSQIALEHRTADLHVIEASSFQLEATQAFQPDRAVCLNMVPNHLDRHGDLQAYAAAKSRIFLNMSPQGTAVWPEDFPIPVETEATRVHRKDVSMPACAGTRFASGPLRQNLHMLLAGLQGFPGISDDIVEAVAKRFQFPEHRLQILEIPGAGRIIDDSKSTCFSATQAAVESIPGRIHLIMGGIDKEEDPAPLRGCFEKRNPVLYFYGRSGKKMRDAWQDSVDECLLADSLEDVIHLMVKRRTSVDEPIVLSPGCASFDQFKGFEDRGDTFRSLILEKFTNQPL